MANNIDYDARGPGGSTFPRTRQLPVQVGATWKKGDFLIWTATGLSGPPAAGSNYAPTSNTTRLAGRALAPSVDPTTGLAYTSAQIEVCEPGTQFPIALYHSTPASAVPTLAQLGIAYELRNSTAVGGVTFPQIDLTATTNVAGRIVSFVQSTGGVTDIPNWPDNVTGAVQGSLAWFEFVGAACQFTGAR